MANEITLSINLTVNSSLYTPGQKSHTVQIDQTTFSGHETVQSIGTTVEALTEGDITSPGVFWMRNLDPSNFVTIGGTTDSLPFKLKAGEIGCLRRGTTDSLYAKADTAEVKLWHFLLSD